MKNVHLVSLGCARNQVDSEEMLGRLKAAGWCISGTPDDAHVIIVNTCSFIESAIDESIDTILALAEYKKSGPCKKLIVTGCLPERFREAIVSELPEVDHFLGAGAFDRITEAAEDALGQSKCLLPDPDAILPPDDNPRIPTLSHCAYLKIAEGCSRHCTYCIIPKLRGKQKSRPLPSLLSDARNLLDGGTRELVLVAQDSTAYGSEKKDGQTLDRLLTDLSDMAGDTWIRVLYGHPQSITAEMIRVMSERANICSYYDLPIQHAADPVLKQMGRRHPNEMLRGLFSNIRKADPEAVLRTTIIVGFPGETDEDFKELVNFIKEIRFNHLGVFTYSDSDDLPSHRLPDPVPEEIAQERFERLMAVQLKISSEKNEKHLDRTYRVLIEESPEPDLYVGRTAFQAPEVDGIVYVHSENPLKIGEFAMVKITDTLEYDLVGDAV